MSFKVARLPGMRLVRAVVVTGVVCLAGLAASPAGAASTTVAWGTTNSAPAGTRAGLFGVAASSSSDVLAVGGYNPGESPTAVLTRPYAEHWNGSGWSATTVPLAPVYSVQAAQLNGVAEVAAGDGWAVGTVSDPSSQASQTLAYHWDGSTWQRASTPDPSGPSQGNELAAVAARASNDVWAAGGDGYPQASLVLHWNGSTWAQVPVPNVGALDAVATTPGDIWVAGGNKVEQFNGSAWTTLPALPGSGGVILGLAHTAAGLWAVGFESFGCGEGGACSSSFAALWNGSAWTRVPAGQGAELSSVVAVGSQVLAAGGTGVWQLTTTAATAQVIPAQNPAQLSAIGADPAGDPWAVGAAYVQGTTAPAIINAPGIGQGGIAVDAGAANATVTWTGPVTGTGGTTVDGTFATGGLPNGTYTVITSFSGCQPGVATATVTAGQVTPITAKVVCPP
jgi:hypothetical protein